MVYTIIAVHDRNVGTVIPSYPTGKEDMRDESIRRFAPVLLCVTSRERRYLVLHVTNRAAEYNLEIGTFRFRLAIQMQGNISTVALAKDFYIVYNC